MSKDINIEELQKQLAEANQRITELESDKPTSEYPAGGGFYQQLDQKGNEVIKCVVSAPLVGSDGKLVKFDSNGYPKTAQDDQAYWCTLTCSKEYYPQLMAIAKQCKIFINYESIFTPKDKLKDSKPPKVESKTIDVDNIPI